MDAWSAWLEAEIAGVLILEVAAMLMLDHNWDKHVELIYTEMAGSYSNTLQDLCSTSFIFCVMKITLKSSLWLCFFL